MENKAEDIMPLYKPLHFKYSCILNASYRSLTISKCMQENWKRCREWKHADQFPHGKWLNGLEFFRLKERWWRSNDTSRWHVQNRKIWSSYNMQLSCATIHSFAVDPRIIDGFKKPLTNLWTPFWLRRDLDTSGRYSLHLIMFFPRHPLLASVTGKTLDGFLVWMIIFVLTFLIRSWTR